MIPEPCDFVFRGPSDEIRVLTIESYEGGFVVIQDQDTQKNTSSICFPAAMISEVIEALKLFKEAA